MALEDVRKKIDSIDQQMKELFLQRMAASEEVLQTKVQTGDSVYKPEREAEMLERMTSDLAPEMKQGYTAFLNKIVQISKEYQYERLLDIRNDLGIQWIEGTKTFKKVATLKSQLYICDMFPKDEVKTVDSWEELMTLIETGVVDAGVGIIETVGDDVYGELYKVISNYNLYINGRKSVPDGEHIRKVVVFSQDLIVKPDHRYLNFKFKCNYQAGQLAKALSAFGDYGIRVKKIHSIPNPDVEKQYDFYAVIESNLLDKKTQAAIKQLKTECEYFQIIGSY